MDQLKLSSKRTVQRKIKATVQQHLVDIHAVSVSNSDSKIKLSDHTLSNAKCENNGLEVGILMANENIEKVDELSSQKETNPCIESDEEMDFESELEKCDFDFDTEVDSELFEIVSMTEHASNSQDELANWAIKHNITHSALSELLVIVGKYTPGLSKDARTLLSTPRESSVSNVAGGSYFYFGIAKTLTRIVDKNAVFHELDANETLGLIVNIDGIPVFKSCSISLWPILCTVKEFPSIGPFVIALFCHTSKPSSVDAYLKDFVSEMTSLQTNGIVLKSKSYKISIYAIICDAPARAFLKCIKSHGGYNSCERCIQRGQWQRKVIFPFVKSRAPLRTDSGFLQMTNTEHHTGRSPFCDLSVGMVTQWPLDYMHLVCLGVMRRLIMLWVKGPRLLNVKLSMQHIGIISDSMIRLRGYIPREFSRKPRSLMDVSHWKATEFRLFLLYVGPVVLFDCLPQRQYANFLSLSVAIRLCLSSNVCSSLIDYAERLLSHFVETFSIIYGESQLVYNVHGLLHLVDDVRRYGPLDNVSAFKFENYLGILKTKVRSRFNVVAQIVRRIREEETISHSAHKTLLDHFPETADAFKILHNDGPIPVAYRQFRQYKQYRSTSNGLFISTSNGDNCCIIGGKLGFVRNILFEESADDGVVVFEEFEVTEPLFTEPLSSDRLSIYYGRRLSGLRQKVVGVA